MNRGWAFASAARSCWLVDVGAQVRKGQVLAQLDPQDLKLAETAALECRRGDQPVRACQGQTGALPRPAGEELHQPGGTRPAPVGTRTALAQLNAVRAQSSIQDNQADYTALRADADGVITAVEAEAGQVVTSGQVVFRLAQTAEKEIAIGVPEDKVEAIRAAPRVEVSLWAAPGRASSGRIREIAPAADPATRTYAVRVTVDAPPPAMRWGMTANVRFAARTPAPLIRVPLSALLREGEQTLVWLMDPKASTVQRVPVTVAGPNGTNAPPAGGRRRGR